MDRIFTRFADACGRWMGSQWAFVIALFFTAVWFISGPWFTFSDTWQLVINTSTTIMTFLMVFLIQNTQNRNEAALHLKLDELIRAIGDASDEFRGIETASQHEIAQLSKKERDK